MLKYIPSWVWWCPPIIPAAGCWVWTSLGSIEILPTKHPPDLTLTVTLLWILLWHLTSFQLCIFWNMWNFYCKDLQLFEFKNWFLDFSRFWRSWNLFQATLYSSNNTLLLGAWFILFAKSYWSGNGSVNAHQLSTYSIEQTFQRPGEQVMFVNLIQTGVVWEEGAWVVWRKPGNVWDMVLPFCPFGNW